MGVTGRLTGVLLPLWSVSQTVDVTEIKDNDHHCNRRNNKVTHTKGECDNKGSFKCYIKLWGWGCSVQAVSALSRCTAQIVCVTRGVGRVTFSEKCVT